MSSHSLSRLAFRAYTVVKREGKEDFWHSLGVAFPHEDDEGRMLLQELPMDGMIVLRTYKVEEHEKPKGKTGTHKK